MMTEQEKEFEQIAQVLSDRFIFNKETEKSRWEHGEVRFRITGSDYWYFLRKSFGDGFLLGTTAHGVAKGEAGITLNDFLNKLTPEYLKTLLYC